MIFEPHKSVRQKRFKAEAQANFGASIAVHASLGEREGEAALSQLFRASIGLQKAFDLCFAQTGLTAQEAAVLLRCVDAEKMFAGKLAQEIDRDKGKITRFIDRLESSGFVRRESDPRDHRVLIIKPTARARHVVPRIRLIFEQIREQLFVGIQGDDLSRLRSVLSQLHENAERLRKDETLAGPEVNTKPRAPR